MNAFIRRRRVTKSRRWIANAAALTLLAGSNALFAAPASWDGGAGGTVHNWNTATNWNPDGVPTATTDVTLGAGITSGLTIVVGNPGAFANILTVATLNEFTISPSQSAWYLTLTTGDLTRVDLPGTEADQTIEKVSIADDGLWDVRGQGMLSVLTLTDGFAGHSFTKTGAGTLAVQTAFIGGAITVSQGILRVGFFTGTQATVATGASLQLESTDFISPVFLAGSGLVGAGALRNISGASEMSGPITLTSAAQVNSDSGTLLLSGGITDGPASFSFAKGGAGIVILTGPGTYDGNTTVVEGTLIAGHNSALGNGTTFVDPGATLQIADTINLPRPINLGGTLSAAAGNGSTSGAITLTDNAAIDVSNTAVLNLTGSLLDSTGFTLTKTGPGMAILSGPNTAQSPLIVAGGVLRTTTILPSGPLCTVQNGATLDLQNNLTINRPLQISGAGSAGVGALSSSSGDNTWLGSVALQLDSSVGVSADTLTLAGPVSGAFRLTKVGAGTLKLTNASNSFSSLDIAAGTLSLTTQTPIPVAAPISVQSGGTLSVSGAAAFNRTLNLNGTGSSPSTGALDSEVDNNTWSGPITLQSNSTTTVRAGRLTISGNISGAFMLTKGGSGELSLNTANSYGDTFISEGLLTARAASALPPNQTATVAPGATLQLSNNITTSATAALRLSGQGATGQGALFNTSGANSFAGPITLISDTSIGVAGGTTLTLSGLISDDAIPLPLVKSGQGTLVLTGSKTYRGGTVVNGGTLSINADARLGASAGSLILNNGGKLLITANTTSGRTFNLNNGSLQPIAGVTLIYNGATVSGGFLRGPGTHQINANSSFSGVTALSDSSIVQSASTNLNNFTNSGTFVSNASVTWDGGYNTGAGEFTLNSTLTTSGFENNGRIIINDAATLTNNGVRLASTGGSRITINSGGALNVTNNALDLNGALLVNNGTITGPTNVNFGSLAKGSGVYGAVNVTDGGKFSPGNSPGSVTTGSVSWNPGGTYTVEIADALGAPGTGWDLWNIAGDLLTNASTDPSGHFTISLTSLAANAPGFATNFDPNHEYHWRILSPTNSLQQIDLFILNLDATGFANDTRGGHFTLSSDSAGLYINFISVPEPSLACLLVSVPALLLRRNKLWF